MAAELEDRHILWKTLLNTYPRAPERTKECVDTVRYIGVILGDQVGRKAAEIVGLLDTVLDVGSVLSVVKGLTVYKQLLVPVTDCACPICVCSTRTHVVQTRLWRKCVRHFEVVTSYAVNKGIDEVLEN
jgi:hypothetical protein